MILPHLACAIMHSGGCAPLATRPDLLRATQLTARGHSSDHSLEEAASYWSKSLTWRSFVGCMLAAVIGKATSTGFTSIPIEGFMGFPDIYAGYLRS